MGSVEPGKHEAEVDRRWIPLGILLHLPQGTVFSEHTHPVDKKDAVLEGKFAITIEGEEFLLRAGDVIEIPSNTIHQAEVKGNIPVMSLDAARELK